MPLTELLQFEFVWRAIIAGVLVSVMCSSLGVFVVQRKMSFLGSGLSHSALGGIGIGVFLGIDPTLVAVPFTLLVALLIFLLREKTNLEIDTSIGILFSAAVALGIVLISNTAGFTGEAYSYLFGSILAISKSDVFIAIISTILILLVVIKYWGSFAYSTFDRELALSDGINVVREDYILACLLAVATVVAIKLVGIVLISAFLVLPAASARLISDRFSSMTIFAIIISVFTCIFGLLLSFVLDFPSGATIILLQTFVFVIALIFSKYK